MVNLKKEVLKLEWHIVVVVVVVVVVVIVIVLYSGLHTCSMPFSELLRKRCFGNQ